MKKNLLITPLLFLALLSGCSFQRNANNSTAFEKKEKCFTYKEEATGKYNYDSMEVFYSPTMDTCIFAYWDYKASEDNTHYYTIHVIKDLFNDKILFSQTNAPLWQEKVDELKK